jgi:multicomponent Na+:H+ antiporter subunit D
MLVGVLGALAQRDVRRILSFQIISHIGFMVMGLGLFSVAGLAATVIYTIHHIVAKTSLFLTSGLIEHTGGSSRLSRLGGMVTTAPVLALLFVVPALSLVGVPPFPGFVAKVALVDAVASRADWALLVVALVASLLTLYSLMKVWAAVFWGSPPEPAAATPEGGLRLGGPVLMVVPTAALVLGVVAMGLAAGPVYDFCLRAAADLLDPRAYISAVLG